MALVQANQSFSVGHFVVGVGDIYDTSDPIVTAYRSLFSDVGVKSSIPVRRSLTSPSGSALETAAADPGALRKLSKSPLKSSETRPPEVPGHA